MVIRFDGTSNASAQHIGKVSKGGILKVWGFFPFWIGKDRAGLESTQPNPTAANLEVRDGLYIVNTVAQSGEIKPFLIPWEGEVWVLNSGKMPGESVSNIVIIDRESC